MFGKVLDFLGGSFLSSVFGLIDKAIPDADAAQQIKAEIQRNFMSYQNSLIENSTKIILAEAGGQSWLQRNWRPLLMLTCIVIIANNYIFFPYASAMGLPAQKLDLPDELWNLLNLGVGGYVIGKSAEQVATNIATVWSKK